MSHLDWHVGMKVVCVEGAAHSSHTRGGWAPKTGGIYTVRGIYPGPQWVQIHLMEYIHHEKHPDGFEIGWKASRFRPVQTRKTDISLFEAILRGARVSEDV